MKQLHFNLYTSYKLQQLLSWARAGSYWPLTFGLACCAIEMMQTAMARYDQDRLGIIFRSSPRHADVLLVAGTITYKMQFYVKRLYLQLTTPRWVLAMGSCALGGGYYYYSYAVLRGVKILYYPDFLIPGCPPFAESLLYTFIYMQNYLNTLLLWSIVYIIEPVVVFAIYANNAFYLKLLGTLNVCDCNYVLYFL